MSSEKPTQDQLLNELASIRDFLTDPEHSEEEIPTLTMVAEKDLTPPAAADTTTNETVIEPTQSELDALKHAYNDEYQGIQDENNLDEDDLDIELELDEIEPHDEQALESTQEKPLNLQTSLFDSPDIEAKTTQTEESSTKKPEENTDEQNAVEAETSEPSANTEPENTHYESMPKGAGENPFLPPHIRERLGKHKEVYEFFKEKNAEAKKNNTSKTREAEIQGDLLNGFPSEPPKSKDDNALDQLMEAVIKEFMPKIEKRFREKLKESLTKPT